MGNFEEKLKAAVEQLNATTRPAVEGEKTDVTITIDKMVKDGKTN